MASSAKENAAAAPKSLPRLSMSHLGSSFSAGNPSASAESLSFCRRIFLSTPFTTPESSGKPSSFAASTVSFTEAYSSVLMKRSS